MKLRDVSKWALLLILVALPSIAMAQIFGGDIPDEDVSVKNLLSPIFGELVGRDGGSDPLVVLIKVFNLGVLSLGGILVFYTLVAGTLSTAHDGEMLGKRWSSLWIPIRTTLGAAAIMPTIGGGYAVIQALVMWLAMQGVSMANTMWSAYLDNDPVAEAFYVTPGATRQIREYLNGMFLSSVCTESSKQTQKNINGAAAEIVGMTPFAINIEPFTDRFAVGYIYGGMGDSTCGRVVLSTGADAVLNKAENSMGSDSGGPASAAALVDAKGMNKALYGVHKGMMDTAKQRLELMAQVLVLQGLSQEQFDRNMNWLVDQYTTKLRERAIAEHEKTKEAVQKKLIDGMKKDGWALAGMYYMAIIRSQDEINRSISQIPGVVDGPSFVQGDFDDLLWGHADRKAWRDTAKNLIKTSGSNDLTTVEEISDDATGGSLVTALVSWFMNSDLTQFGNTQFSQQGQNPILMAKNLGENMTATAWGGLVLGGGALALSSTKVVGTGFEWATVFSPPLFALFSLLVVPGAILSTYVPMIPYILWLGVLLGWVILIVEAVIAAPIWAVSHMAPDGDGVVGRGGQGYMLVLSLVLRPPLMILGLVCAIVLMKPVGYLVNSTFLGAFAMGANPGAAALTQLIAGCILYVVVMISIIHRIFTLIHVIPDRILRWIGGGGNELGEQAQGMESFSSGKTIAAASAMNQIGHLSQGMAQGIRDLSRKQADRGNADAIRAEESRSRQAQVEANKGDDAYRAGQDARMASAAAEKAPSDQRARDSAVTSNMMARDARMGEAETKIDHAMEQGGVSGGLAGWRAMDQGQKDRAMARAQKENPRLAEAMDFSNQMDQARRQDAIDPDSGAMKGFLEQAQSSVRQRGSAANSWDAAAAKGYEFEAEREKWSQPPPPPSEESPGS